MIKKISLCVVLLLLAGVADHCRAHDLKKVAALEKKISGLVPNPAYKDDIYGIKVINTALQSVKEGSGGIGACLVDSISGKIVEQGRNRQYTTHFRSDLHAEMDLLNRYEDRAGKTHSPGTGGNPRNCPNLVLVTSVEPCPMCLTRIINAGIKTVLFVVEDRQGGMVTRMDSLPPFWREFAADREFKKADCSPKLVRIAHELFHLSGRDFAKNRKKSQNPDK